MKVIELNKNALSSNDARNESTNSPSISSGSPRDSLR